MEGGRRTTTVRQLELLVEFAEANRDLALGRLRSKESRALSNRLWQESAEDLNVEGPARLPKEWAKIWTDLKCKVRSKLTCCTLSQRGTGGGPNINVTFTNIEQRVADIIGRDSGPLPNVAQNPFLQVSNDDVVMVQDQISEQHVLNLDMIEEPLHLSVPTSSSPSQFLPQPPQSPTQSTPTTPRLASHPASLPPSALSTPRQRAPRSRQRPRPPRPQRGSRVHTPRPQRGTRVHTPAETNRSRLDNSRVLVLQIEKMRAEGSLRRDEAAKAKAEAAKEAAEAAKESANASKTLSEAAMVSAEAAMMSAEAAMMSAEADHLRAQSMATFWQSVASNLVPAICHYLGRTTGLGRTTSSEEE